MGHPRKPQVILSYDEKKMALEYYFENNLNTNELAGMTGVQPATARRWLHIIERDISNIERLKGSQKKPESPVTKDLSDDLKAEIHSLLSEHPEMGPLKIKQYLFRHKQKLISEKRIYRYLKATGVIEARRKERQEKQEHNKNFEYPKPLEAVQIDLLEFKLVNKKTIYLISLIDDHSRFILLSRFVIEHTMDNVISMITKSLQEYGYIEKILSDKGSEFVSWHNFSRFEDYLCTLDIELISSGPNMPYIQGKIERWHQTMRTEFEANCGGFTTLFEAQTALDRYVNYYNYERPHQGIDGLVPADRFFGMARDLKKELLKYKSGNMKDKRIYFCCNIEGKRLVVSGMRNGQLSVYENNATQIEGKKDIVDELRKHV